MIQRLSIAAVGLLLLMLGVMAAVTSPPRLLTILDRGWGGGEGVEQPGRAIGFGSQHQTLDVWRPTEQSGAGARKLPVLIFWYGGGWANGDRAAYGFAARGIASRGFVVVVPDYRKVPDVRFPAFLQDGAEAVRWTRDHVAGFGGDAGQIGLAGHSAGAYTSVMLALDRRWLLAAGVDPSIVRAAVGLCGPYDFFPWTSRRAVDAMRGVADPAMTQPINFARAVAPPLLLITATHDTQVRPRNALHLSARLAALGAPYRLINYRGLTHEDVAMALSSVFRGKAPVLADMTDFLHAALARRRTVVDDVADNPESLHAR